MKKTFIFIFIISISKLFGQFSISTELRYLQIINKQSSKELIEDNLKNAELASDSLILTGENKLLYAQFFNALSESYFLTKNYELSLFSLLRQRCLFSNKAIEQKQKVLFLETAYSYFFNKNSEFSKSSKKP